MQDGFQVVPFSWVLAVKQLNEAFRERLVQMFGHLLRSDVRAHYELQKQLINKLQVGPRLCRPRTAKERQAPRAQAKSTH